MLAVRRDHRVLGAERGEHAGRDRLLADVEVEEAADLLCRVVLGAALLEPPDRGSSAPQQPRAPRRASGVTARPRASTVSPSGRPSSRARNSRRMILPLRVRGRSGDERDLARRDRGPEVLARDARALRRAAPRWPRYPGLSDDERLDDLAGDRVRDADRRGLGDRRMLEQRALDLERANQVARAS